MGIPRFDDKTPGILEEQSQTRADSRLVLIFPLLCALLYPFLLRLIPLCAALLHIAKPLSAAATAVGVLVTLVLAGSVMWISFAQERALAKRSRLGIAQRRARVLAHLAFASASLWVGFENLAGVAHDRTAALIAWPILWAVLAAAVLLSSNAPAAARELRAKGYRQLGTVHGISAIAIVVLFIAPHIANHLTGIWNGATHIATMRDVRLVYRNEVIQPLLLTLIGFQILSGTVLARARLHQQNSIFGSLQTMTGVYVGVYLLAHMTAVFSARYAGTDTNWTWLTDGGRSMLPSLAGVSLVAHYWMGTVAIFTHIGCGIRGVLLQNTIAPGRAARVARGLIGLGVAASSVILIALLGVHIA
ncbi:MAG: hypothetical protein ACRETK_01975 [Steroidobacteraceae bacterium]